MTDPIHLLRRNQCEETILYVGKKAEIYFKYCVLMKNSIYLLSFVNQKIFKPIRFRPTKHILRKELINFCSKPKLKTKFYLFLSF